MIFIDTKPEVSETPVTESETVKKSGATKNNKYPVSNYLNCGVKYLAYSKSLQWSTVFQFYSGCRGILAQAKLKLKLSLTSQC